MLKMERRIIPIRVITIPKICWRVILSLKTIKARVANRVGYDPAIGATIATKPLLIAKLKLRDPRPTMAELAIKGIIAPLILGFFNFKLLNFIKSKMTGKALIEIIEGQYQPISRTGILINAQ